MGDAAQWPLETEKMMSPMQITLEMRVFHVTDDPSSLTCYAKTASLKRVIGYVDLRNLATF
jgi:hypothetical protein